MLYYQILNILSNIEYIINYLMYYQLFNILVHIPHVYGFAPQSFRADPPPPTIHRPGERPMSIHAPGNSHNPFLNPHSDQ